MKKLIVLFLLSFVVFAACKKEDKMITHNNPTSQYCSGNSFQSTINDLLNPTTIIEDDRNNIFVLGRRNSYVAVVKMDTAGNVLWNKDFPTINGFPANIMALPDGSVVVSSALQNDVVPSANNPGLNNVYLQNAIYPQLNCEPYFVLGNSDAFTVESESYLTKIDKDGNELWSLSLEGSDAKGSTMFTDSKGDICFVSMKLKGRDPVLVYDANGVFQDTILYPRNKNTIKVYRINVAGSIVNENEIANVFNSSYDNLTSNIDFAEVNQNYIIKAEKKLYYLNANFDVVKQQEVKSQYCNYYAKSMCAQSDHYLVYGYYMTLDTVNIGYVYNRYTQKFSLNNTLIWEVKNNDMPVASCNNRYITKTTNGTDFSAYNEDGKFEWHISFPSPAKCTMNCQKGITATYTLNGQLVVTRTDANGNY